MLVALTAQYGFAAPEELTDKNSELAHVQESIEFVQHSLGALETERSSLAGQLGRIEQKYGYLNRTRFSQLQTLQKDLAQVRVLEDELLAESARLSSTRVEIRREQAELEEAQLQRQEVLGKLEREFKDKKIHLKQLQEDARRLQGLIASLQQAVEDVPIAAHGGRDSFASLRGQLGWPVQGELLDHFSDSRMSGRWDGVLIRAQEGAAVRAVSQGGVRSCFFGLAGGYGLLTIIDHGDGYMSLYAFNQS